MFNVASDNFIMKKIFIPLGFILLAVSPHAYSLTDIDKCLQELANFDFGDVQKRKDHEFRPIELKIGGEYYRWDGTVISKANVKLSQEVGTPFKFANEPEASRQAKPIWDLSKITDVGQDGRIDKSFPSKDLDNIKRKIAENSFYNIPRVKLNARNIKTVFFAAIACQPLKDLGIPPGLREGRPPEKTVSEAAARVIHEIKSKFPEGANSMNEAFK